MKRYYSIILVVIFIVFAFLGCAGRKEVTEIPKISSGELIDSLLAQDTVVHRVRLLGKGVFESESEKRGFRVGLVSDRDNQRLGVYLGAGLTGVFAILWLCHQDSLCIYIALKKYVIVEPIGAQIEGVVLPPKASVMIDMFSGLSPLASFKDSLTNYEPTPSGYYLTFEKNNEALIIFAKPNPWHIDGYQWVQNTEPKQIVDVQFEDGKITDNIWRPENIKISQPSLDQEINLKIDKYIINPEIGDSLFEPEIPEKAYWYRAF